MEFLQPKIKEKRWDFRLEGKVLKGWKGLYKFNPASKKKIFVIDTPPPYPSGRPWHIGAAAHYSQIDMIARAARMMNNEVLFPIGIDRNGLPVELYTERKYKVNIHDTPREKFIELCKAALDDLEAEMIRIMKAMGLSSDFENYYRTDSEEYRKLTQETFIELWNRGMIYENTRPNNYCPVCATTIADAEVLYEDRPTELVYIKFPLKEGGFITVATTRPEFICSCQTIIVHPDDARYEKLVGKTALTPLYEREVKIISHPSAAMEFGSGAAMICSYGDFEDVRLFRELGLQEIIALDTSGKMTENAGKYAGMTVEEARRKIIEDLEAGNYVERKEKITHRTPVCERSKNPIEIIPMKEFYLKQIEFIDDIRKFAETLIFHPEIHRQLLLNWIDSIKIDWPISRRRYYGTEIPIWYCKNCNKAFVPKPGKYYRPWKDRPPFAKCDSCGGKDFVGETRTFDMWMDSSISPLFISRYKRDEKFFKKTFPNTLRPQAKDIVRTWMYYTLLRCYQLTGEMAWKHAWVMGYGVDEKGEKMSKSKGNVIDPYPILEKYGADAFRFWACSESSVGYDFRFNENKIGAANKFLTKLWNVSRFISMFPQPKKKPKLSAADKWILAELNKTIKESLKGYEEFNFFIPANKVREFLWNVFADHYVEMVKPRAYGEGFTAAERDAARYTLHECLKTVLILAAPIIPFITDFVYTKLYSVKSVHTEEFPKAGSDELSSYTKRIIEFNSAVWNEKKKRAISLRDEIQIEIPKQLKDFEKDLRAMHHIK